MIFVYHVRDGDEVQEMAIAQKWHVTPFTSLSYLKLHNLGFQKCKHLR